VGHYHDQWPWSVSITAILTLLLKWRSGQPERHLSRQAIRLPVVASIGYVFLHNAVLPWMICNCQHYYYANSRPYHTTIVPLISTVLHLISRSSFKVFRHNMYAVIFHTLSLCLPCNAFNEWVQGGRRQETNQPSDQMLAASNMREMKEIVVEMKRRIASWVPLICFGASSNSNFIFSILWLWKWRSPLVSETWYPALLTNDQVNQTPHALKISTWHSC
jgi:hypothetical protein